MSCVFTFNLAYMEDRCAKCGRSSTNVIPGLPCKGSLKKKNKKKRRAKKNPIHSDIKSVAGLDLDVGVGVGMDAIIDPVLRRALDESRAAPARPPARPAGVPTLAERQAQSAAARLREWDFGEAGAASGHDGDSVRFLREFGPMFNGPMFIAHRQDKLDDATALMGNSISGTAYLMMDRGQLDLVTKTGFVRGKLHRIILTRVFDRDLEATMDFYRDVVSADDKLGVTRRFSSRDAPGYGDLNEYSVIRFVYDMVRLEPDAELAYRELFRIARAS